MNKICTDIEQSRKLLKLGLNPNTADMYYLNDMCELNPHMIDNSFFGTNVRRESILAWSLTALLKLMPSRIDGFYTKLTKLHDNNGWCIEGHEKVGEPVDAAFEMVVWLIEKGYMMTI